MDPAIRQRKLEIYQAEYAVLFPTKNEVTEFKYQRNLYRFEPKGFKEKIKAIFQNTFETVIANLVISLALMYPSWVSLIFAFLTCNSILISKFDQDKRLSWGRYYNVLQIGLLVIISCWKIVTIQDTVVTGTYDEYKENIDFYASWGYNI